MSEKKPDLHIVELYPSNFRDVPATLRVVADDIEAGKYGTVGELALVLMGDAVEVFGMGPEACGTSTVCLLQAGALRIVRMVERHGR